MKIAILSFYSGLEKRGVERWVKELASRISNRHEVVVFQNGPKESIAKYETVCLNLPFNLHKKEINLPPLKRAFLDYRGRKVAIFALKLLPYLWRERFDIVIPTDGGWEPALVRILSWVTCAKMLIVGHAGIGWDDRNNLWCFPDTFVALSSFAKMWAKRVNPFVKVRYIPDGVDTEKFNPQGKTFFSGLEKPIVLCTAAAIKSKRIDLTIKAVSLAKNLSLLVVGSGELVQELQRLGEKLLGKRFKITNFEFNEMPEVYRGCDLFTVASMPEYSFEMVLLEAMACNLPVVADSDPIREEIVGDAGILVDPTATKSYATALNAAVDKNWGNKPRRQAAKFAWDKIVREYEKLFRSLGGRKIFEV